MPNEQTIIQKLQIGYKVRLKNGRDGDVVKITDQSIQLFSWCVKQSGYELINIDPTQIKEIITCRKNTI